MPNANDAYLSLLSWPTGFTDDQKIEALVMAAALDPHQAKLAIRRRLPAVICSIDAVLAPEILRVLHDLGALALAPTQEQFEQYPKPELPNSVEVFPEKELAAFAVRTRDGGAWTFQAPELRFVVFGKARATTTRIQSKRATYNAIKPSGAAVARALRGDGSVRVDKTMRVKPMLDLHIDQMTPAGVTRRLVRLVGGRTRIGLIGDGDPRPPLLDQSTPVKDIQALAPNARYDLGFERFSPPLDARYRARHGNHRLNADTFAFYSVWTALMNTMLYG